MQRLPILFLLLLGSLGLLAQADLERLKQLHAAGEFEQLENAARELSVSDDHRTRYEAEYHWAFARSGKDDPAGAVEHAQKALLLARELPDTTRMLASLYQLTKLNVEGRHYQEADRFRHEHLALAQAFERDTIQLALAHNSMGSMYSRLGQPEKEEFHYREGLRVLGAREHVVKLALLGNLASSLSAHGAHEEAARLHAEVLAQLDSTDLHDRAWTYSNLGRSLLYAKKPAEALRAFDIGDSLNAASGNALDLAIDFAELRAECLKTMGDIPGAYAMVKHARDLQDTLFVRSMDEQYLELEKRFETQLKEEEIQRLDAEAREREERLRVRNVQLYGSIALAVMALGGIVLVWRNLRQKRRHAAVLEGLNAELKDQKERIEEINRLLQLKVLRTQMNPHFIYNCLHAIGNLVRDGDAVGAANYLDGFARLLRTVLDHSVKDSVPLSQDMDFLRQYLKLEALRFGNGLSYSVDADPALLDEDDAVPALVVQPFVENAIWHGLATKEGAKRVSVHFAERDGRIICTIEDNGIGRAASPERKHTDGSPSLGLQLTNERLQLLSFKLGKAGRVTFTDLVDGATPAGTRVEVLLG
ncbi:MAG: histidine kinase [Flavobacteriales bacterium]